MKDVSDDSNKDDINKDDDEVIVRYVWNPDIGDYVFERYLSEKKKKYKVKRVK